MTGDRKFMYFGWLPILELDALNGNAVLRAYAWGLDLAAQIGAPSRDREGAGLVGHAGLGGPALQGLAGVGGLLAVHQAQTGGGAGALGNPLSRQGQVGGLDAGDYVYFHDTSGNVGQLVAGRRPARARINRCGGSSWPAAAPQGRALIGRRGGPQLSPHLRPAGAGVNSRGRSGRSPRKPPVMRMNTSEPRRCSLVSQGGFRDSIDMGGATEGVPTVETAALSGRE